ncbi:hypothetical protein [Streptomyces odontomachi]|uniref:hypothetical protein n=1 Tax=Streptomyces odontomachi TaxID=2944940 RepID=UPI00210E70E7|nr:hypothetical protein [Streptomyces sp. ODS25]
MSPGRHRHSPPLHKMLPPSAIAGISLVCAAATWLSVNVQVLRALAAAAAVATVVCAIVMRSWDRVAGKRVADLRRARESDAWSHEERVAELEGDLEESRAIRTKLEQGLRQKRTELTALRTEHAALLRRYATAETERASALEGRRRLAIEAAPSSRAMTPVPAEPQRPVSPWQAARASSRQGHDGQQPTARVPEVQRAAETMESGVVRSGVAPYEDAPFGAAPVGSGAREAERSGGAPSGTGQVEQQRKGEEPRSDVGRRALPPAAPKPTPALFRRAKAALDTLGRAGTSEADTAEHGSDGTRERASDGIREHGSGEARERGGDGAPGRGGDGARERGGDGARERGQDDTRPADDKHADVVPRVPPQEPPPRPGGAAARPGVVAQRPGLGVPPSAVAARQRASGAGEQQAEARGERDGRTDGGPSASGRYPAIPAAATAVPPAAPMRPAPKGGFDFFGNQSAADTAPPANSPSALDTVRNADLADVVGDEALALHKAEAEAGFKPAGAMETGAGQVIDLTAHDETEQIDVSGLRNAVS